MKVIAVMASTVDGRIGISDAHFPDWTGKSDKRMFKKITMKAGAVIMGSKTFDTIGKPLLERKNIVMTREPTRISHWNNLIYSSKSPEEILDNLTAEGFQEVVLAGGATINTLFAKAGLIDELVITYAPKIFGQGLSLFSESVFMELSLLELKTLEDGVIYAHYRILSIKCS